MRPSVILSLIAAVLTGLSGVALAVWLLVDRSGGKPWHYWAAPPLALGFGGMLFFLAFQYYARVGRLEMKGRPRSE